MSEVFRGHIFVIVCILLLIISNLIFHFIINSLGLRVYFFPFDVLIDNTCRSLNPLDAARSIQYLLKVTGSSALDMMLDTIKFLFLGSFNTPLKSVMDSSCYWCVVLCGFRTSRIEISSSIIFELLSSSLLGIWNRKKDITPSSFNGSLSSCSPK